jgi:hypothetical protein
MLRGQLRTSIGLIGIAFFFTATLPAQLNRGVIEGTLTDPQSAVVPGVDVTITNVETNIAAPLKTNSAGYYRAVDLVPGKYRADFAAAGFASTHITDITLPAGEVIRVDAQLKLSTTQESVQVTAEAPLLETTAANYSARVDTQTIDQLPMQGRDLQQLVFLVPGVSNVGGPPGSNFGFNSQFGSFPDPTHVLGSDLSVHGGQGGANAWYLDGNLNLANIAENVVVNPSPDAVSEFQAVTNAFSAEYGRTGGAVFNVVLKSGTNTPHGTLYEFVRNNATNARNPFTSFDALGNEIPQRALRFNDFGGTIGGPVVLPHVYNGKNKTFFFVSVDAQILHLLDSNQVFTVPTPLMRQGNFSEDPNSVSNGIWDPYSTVGPNSSGIFTRTAFGMPVVGNPFGPNGCTNTAVKAGAAGGFPTCNFSTQIPKSRLDPIAMFFMNSFPMPNYNNALATCPSAAGGQYKICSNFRGAVGSSWDPKNISIKIDHEINAKNRLFGEWLYNPGYYNNYRLPWTGPTFPDAQVGFGSNYPLHLRNQIISLGDTYTITPTLINEFRTGFSRLFMGTNLNQPYPDSVSDQTQVAQMLAAVHMPTQPFNPVPIWNIGTPAGGFITFGPQAFVNMDQAAEAYTTVENLTAVLGKHTLKTGFMYRLEHQAIEFGGPMIFNLFGELTQDPTTGLGGSGLAQFMLGAASSNGGTVEQVNWEPYLRFRYWGSYLQDDYRITSNLTLNLGLRYDLFGMWKIRQQPNSNFCLSCPNPLTGLPGKVVYSGDPQLPKGHDIYPANKNDFGPRVNFAWTPFGNRKTVIRGGYDIFFSNAFQGANSIQSGANSPGYNIDYSWNDSFFPKQCAPFTGQCVAFPLSDTSTIKTQLPVPRIPASPAQLPGWTRQPLLGGGGFSLFLKPAHDPMIQQWTLEVQRELPADIMLSVGYVGNHGTHLLGELFRQFNYVHTKDLLHYRAAIGAVIPITDVYSGQTAQMLQQVYGTPDLPRSLLLKDYPFFALGLGTNTAWDGTAHYDSMDVQVRKRFSRGLSFVAAYTWSKAMDNGLPGQLGVNVVDPVHFARPGYVGGRAGTGSFSNQTGGLYQDRDHIIDKTIGAVDTPHMFNIAGTYELPFGNGKMFLNHKGPLNLLLGGWQLTGNYNAQSGIPLSISCPGNNVTNRCNLIGNPKFSGSRSRQEEIAQWFNSAAFQPPFGGDQSFWANYDPNDPRAYLFGNAGERLPGARSPGFSNMDTSLTKAFHLTEQRYFQFRWEVFNTLNHQNLGLPNTSFCLPPNPDGSTDRVHQAGCTFGLITNVQTDPRSMEFVLRFYW